MITVDDGQGGEGTGLAAKRRAGPVKRRPETKIDKSKAPATTSGDANAPSALVHRGEFKLLPQKAAKSSVKMDHGREAGSEALTETPGADKSKTGHGKGESRKAVTFVSATGGRGRKGGQGRASLAADAKTEKRR
jgi:hypothetical protein